MPAVFYQVLHVIAVIALAVMSYALITAEDKKPVHKAFGIVGFLVLLGGFGLMAKLGYSFRENMWLSTKLLLWLVVMGGLPVLVKRSGLPGPVLKKIMLLLFLTGVILVYVRPF